MAANLKRALETEQSSSPKRPRISPLPTPPSSDAQSPDPECKVDTESQSLSVLERASHILSTQTRTLSNLAQLYKTDPTAINALEKAVDLVLASHREGGKLIFCAVGKSAYIARKLSATCKSLGIGSSFLHGCEAVHGDLGDVGPGDVLLFVSFSGRTPELLNLLPHLPDGVRVMAISGHANASDCALLATSPESGILLPAPICETEEQSFGVAAPTTSTVAALAVGDMLALMLADDLHGSKTKTVFTKFHPGGAIGLNSKALQKIEKGESLTEAVILPSPEILAEDGIAKDASVS